MLNMSGKTLDISVTRDVQRRNFINKSRTTRISRDEAASSKPTTTKKCVPSTKESTPPTVP